MNKKNHLSRKQINELKRMLEIERESYLNHIHAVNGHGTDVHGDAGDISSSLAETELLWGLEEQERQYLMEVDEALKRIENGTYGVCEECGKPIPYERLKAIPTAKYTVDCQEMIEQQKNTF